MKNKHDVKLNLDYRKLKRFCDLLFFVRKSAETSFSINNLTSEFFSVDSIKSSPRGTNKVTIVLEPSKRFLDLGLAILTREFGFDIVKNIRHNLASYKKYLT